MVLKSTIAARGAARRATKAAQRERSRLIIQKRRTSGRSKILKTSRVITQSKSKSGSSRSSSSSNVKNTNIRRRKLISTNDFAIKKFNQLNAGRSVADKSSFTAATPVGRQNGKLKIQDIQYTFQKRKLIALRRLNGTGIIDEEKFIKKSRVDPISNNVYIRI